MACLAVIIAFLVVGQASAVLPTDTITTIVGGGTSLINDTDDFEGSDIGLFKTGALAANGTRVYFTSLTGSVHEGSVVSYVEAATGNGASLAYRKPSATSAPNYLSGPRGLAVSAGGLLYVSDGSSVTRYSTTSSCTTCGVRVAGQIAADGFSGDGGDATSAKLSAPSALALSAGRLYIADKGNNRVRYVEDGLIDTFAGTGTAGTTGDGGFALNARLKEITGLAVDSAGNVYIASTDRIRKVSAATGKISLVATFTAPAGTCAPRISAMAIDRAGNIYASDQGRHRIHKIVDGSSQPLLAGGCVEGFGGDGGELGAARLSAPRGLAVDSQGSLYIMDSSNSRLRRVRNLPPQAGFTHSPSQTTVNAPITVTFTPNGTYDSNGTIIKYSWKFGGSAAVTTAKKVPRSKTFNNPGTYKVTLTVTDDSGATASASKTLTVK